MRPCESCGAQVEDLRHERTGKLAPIDAMPIAHGGTILVDVGAGTYRVLSKAERAARMVRPDAAEQELDAAPLHRSHFATCSAAGAWRRPK